MVNYEIAEYSAIKHAEIETILGLSFAEEKGYKETLITWLNPKCQVMSNNDIPINEEIAAALDMILKQIKCARIDRSVDEISVWMREKQEKDPHRIGNGRKSKIFTSLL